MLLQCYEPDQPMWLLTYLTYIFWLFVFPHLSSFMFNRKMIHDFSETFQIQYTLSDIFKEIAGCCRYKLLTPANLLNLFFYVKPTVYLQYLMRILLRHLTQTLSFYLWTSTGFTTTYRIWTVNFKVYNLPVFMQLTLLSQLLS